MVEGEEDVSYVAPCSGARRSFKYCIIICMDEATGDYNYGHCMLLMSIRNKS